MMGIVGMRRSSHAKSPSVETGADGRLRAGRRPLGTAVSAAPTHTHAGIRVRVGGHPAVGPLAPTSVEGLPHWRLPAYFGNLHHGGAAPHGQRSR